MKHFEMNQTVQINSDNENYTEYMNQPLRIVHIANCKEDHPGYDESLYPEYLYDLRTLKGEYVPFSLYDYELKKY